MSETFRSSSPPEIWTVSTVEKKLTADMMLPKSIKIGLKYLWRRHEIMMEEPRRIEKNPKI